MKIHHVIAPALALIASVFWFKHQENTLTDLIEKTTVIRERIGIAQRIRTSPETTVSRNVNQEDEFHLPDGSLSWQAIADLMTEAQKSGALSTDMKALTKLMDRLGKLSDLEIAEIFGKLEDFNLEPDTSQQVQSILLQLLIQKNPGMALDLIADLPTTSDLPLDGARQIAFSRLVQENPAAASAWLDQQIKDGKFISKALDPTGNPRLDLEAFLLGSLAATDLAAAQARLATFTDAEKVRIFSNPFQWKLNGKMSPGFLSLARENLNPEKATATIALAWSAISGGELEPVAEALKTLPFSDEERNAVISQSVQQYVQLHLKEPDYQSAYEWAKEQAPDQAASALGRALVDGQRFGKAIGAQFQQALQLSETLNDPDIAREFAREFARHYDPAGRFPKIKDPALAAQVEALADALPKDGE